MPIADQQERKEARHLPEKGDLDEVARQHHAEHRAHESHQKREEARNGIVRRHVIARVKNNQPADSEDENREQPRNSVEPQRSEEHTSELQSLMRISYAVFCLNKKKTIIKISAHHLSKKT